MPQYSSLVRDIAKIQYYLYLQEIVFMYIVVINKFFIRFTAYNNCEYHMSAKRMSLPLVREFIAPLYSSNNLHF